MIYMDVTEDRQGTRLHESARELCKPVVGLEKQTGADFLISTLEEELPGNVITTPGNLILKRHLRAGMLVQRKSGNDLLSSMDKLHNIALRMRSTEAPMSWLLICGQPEKSNDGFVVMEGRKSGWNWWSYVGALDAFQILGCYVNVEPSDKDCAEWLLRWDKKLPKLLADMNRGIQNKIITPEVGAFDPHPQRATLMTFPGCGDGLSKRIFEQFGTLADALVWMSYLESSGVYGVGPSLIKQWHKWLGLEEGQALTVLTDNPKFNGKQAKGKVENG